MRPKIVAVALLTALTVSLLIRTSASATAAVSARRAPGHSASIVRAVDVTADYAAAARCDGPPGPELERPRRRLLIQLIGNSVAGEIRGCLNNIMWSRGVRFETVDPPDFLLCNEVPDIETQVNNPVTRPDAAILFLWAAYDGRCGHPWYASVDRLVATWKAAGTHVFLVPSIPLSPGGVAPDLEPGPLLEASHYEELAARDPEHVTLLDASTFIRGPDGEPAWQMPCLPDGEAGCTLLGVGVRYVDGMHFCTDPEFARHGCVGEEYQAGQRRGAAAVAAGLIPALASISPQEVRPEGWALGAIRPR